MYLSDMFVVAHKRGGDAHVKVLLDILDGLPQDFWDKMGGLQWLMWVKSQYKINPDGFYRGLEQYANSKEWSNSEKSLGEFLQNAGV